MSKNTINQDFEDVMNLYLQDVQAETLLSPEEEFELASKVIAGDTAAKELMIKGNLRLVIKIARNYFHRGLNFADIIEEGNLGLIKAVDKFDPNLGYRFSTYATWWIRQSIEYAIMMQARTIRLPVHVLKSIAHCLRLSRDLANKLQHEPTVKELAKQSDLPLAKIEEILLLDEHAISLDLSVNNTEDFAGVTLVDTIADNSKQDLDENIYHSELQQHMEQWIHNLPVKQQQVLIRRFGLMGYEATTLQQIGEELNLTRERIRQLQVAGLQNLRALMPSSPF